MELNQRAERLNQLRLLRIQKGKKSFWDYCKLTSPDFYFTDRVHLKLLCDSLQAFHENRIVRYGNGPWVIIDCEGIGLDVCKQLYIMMPPRHGKTRTLTKFCEWTLGNNPIYKYMYTSYNDDTAGDTSRFIRDGISAEKIDPSEYIFTDFFDEKLQADNKAISKWALDGQYFNFISAGKGGSVTSKGCDTLIIDDPVKNAEEALNDNESKKTWKWFTDTLLSRMEEGGKTIINHTRWPRRDLIQRLMDHYQQKGHKPYYSLVMPVYNVEKKEMLCPTLMSYTTYLERMDLTDVDVFSANYQQNVKDTKGKLYRNFMVYTHIDDYKDDTDGAMIEGWTDYADTGTDFFAAIIGPTFSTDAGSSMLIKDIFYTQDDVEAYRSTYVDWLIANDVDRMKIESNNGGKGFGLYVEDQIIRRGGKTVIEWELNSSNKHTRIITNNAQVQTKLIFPKDWASRWPLFHEHLTSYQRSGGNEYDDAPDVCTMAVIDLEDGGVIVYG